MGFFQQLLEALPTVATSWQAAFGYVALTVAFVVVSLKVTRNKNLLSKLKSLPENDRARVLQMEMGSAYLAAGLSPEQWLQQERQRFYFLGFLALCALAMALTFAAILTGQGPKPVTRSDEQNRGDEGRSSEVLAEARRSAEKLAQDFVKELHAENFDAAYDLFPSDVKNNISFAQFQLDSKRLLFQIPTAPLKDRIEQSVENGALLGVVVISEFSVETKIRHLVGLARDGNGWKLWNYNWQPIEWPLVWPSATETRQTASDAMKAYRSLNDQERAVLLPDRFRGNITGSSPGWKLVVNATTREHDALQCTVDAVESDSSTAVQLRHVIGGCKLQGGARILVNAMLSGINESRIELDGVRYYPAN